MKKCVYQDESYKKALEAAGEKVVDVNEEFFAVEKELKTAFGKKRVLEARGTSNLKNLKDFKEKAKEYFYGTIIPCVLDKNKKNFEKLGYVDLMNHTILLDLKKSEEELWKELEKKSARWGVKTAEKNRLVIVENCDENDLKEFYKMYEMTAKEGGFTAENYEFLKVLWENDMAQIFLVRQDEIVLGGGMVLMDKDFNYMMLDLTAASKEGLKLQVMPFLYWEMVLFGKKKGLDYFDLGGYDVDALEGDKVYAINRFKKRFGGEIVEEPIYATNKKYILLRNVLKKARFVKNLYKKGL